MNLQSIWERADKELKQCRGYYGNAKQKKACAIGAILYYLSRKRTVNPNFLSEKNFKKNIVS